MPTGGYRGGNKGLKPDEVSEEPRNGRVKLTGWRLRLCGHSPAGWQSRPSSTATPEMRGGRSYRGRRGGALEQKATRRVYSPAAGCSHRNKRASRCQAASRIG